MLQQEPKTTQAAGFTLLKDSTKYEYAAIGDKAHFGNLWDFDPNGTNPWSNPHKGAFVGLDALSGFVDRLPLAEGYPVMAMDGEDVEGHERFQGVRNLATKKPFGIHSDKYAIVQYQELFHPMLEAIQEYDLHIAGFMEELDGGARVKGKSVIGNPDSVIEVLQDTGDFLLMGFRVSASHDGTGAMKLQPFGVRTICCNENIWGQWLPSISLKHIGDPSAQAHRFGEAILGYLSEVPNIKERIDAAATEKIVKDEVALAALGAGLPVRHLAKWEPKMDEWEPALRGNEFPTLWEASNSVSAYVTHETQNLSSDSRERLLTVSEKLLEVKNIDQLLAAGRDKAEELRAKRAEQIQKNQRKTVPEIQGITVGEMA